MRELYQLWVFWRDMRPTWTTQEPSQVANWCHDDDDDADESPNPNLPKFIHIAS